MPKKRTRIVAATALVFGAILSIPDRCAAQPTVLPAPAEGALPQLDRSPRWEEWDRVRDGDDVLNVWTVFPEREDDAPVVLVIHDTLGLTDWVRAVADQLAAEGFIAITPDLLSGKSPGGYGSAAIDPESIVKMTPALEMEEVNRRLNAAVVNSSTLRKRTSVRAGIKPQNQVVPGSSGKIGVVGLGWGATTAFQYAAVQPEVQAVVAYYGSAPAASLLANVQAPVLGLYAGRDESVNATAAGAETTMRELGKPFEKEIFEGADHGFLRLQSGRSGANQKASQQAWNRTVQFLKQHLEP